MRISDFEFKFAIRISKFEINVIPLSLVGFHFEVATLCDNMSDEGLKPDLSLSAEFGGKVRRIPNEGLKPVIPNRYATREPGS